MKVLQDTFLHDCIVGMEYGASSIETQWPSDQETPLGKNLSKTWLYCKVLQDTWLHDCIIGME